MKYYRKNRLLLFAGAIALLLTGAIGCSSDSPSAPQQQPVAPPGGGQGAAYSITVAPSPTQLVVGGDEPTTITVQVRRLDNGQPPGNGTTLNVTTTLGDFQTPGSGLQSVLLQLLSGNAQVLLYPGQIQGGAVVRAQLQGSIGQAGVQIGQAADFFLSFVTPNTGGQQGGETVEITGGGIEEPIRVTFDNIPAQILSVSSSRIRAITPPSGQNVPTGTTRAVNVQVIVRLNSTEQSTDTLNNGFIYLPAGGGGPGGVQQPQIFSVTPASGPNEGGTRVTITGTGFESPVQVFFGDGTDPNAFTGVEATVESVTSSQIVVRTPAASGLGNANNNQTVNILIRNLGTGFAGIGTSQFRYGSEVLITAVSPDQIPYNSRDLVTIFGQGFVAPVNVSVAGLQADIISVTGTEIVVRPRIPAIGNCQDVSGPVVVTNINTGDSDSTDANFIYRAFEPTLFGVNPPSGPGATSVARTATGNAFEDPVRVLFGDAAASITATTSTSISLNTPLFSQFDEESCDDDGDGTQGMRFVNTSVDVEVTNLLTDCTDTLTGGYTYTPSDTSCRGDLGPPVVADPQCSDGIDNDGDGLVDHQSVNPFNFDPQCSGPNDDDESS
jgi:hypothetical protein